MTASSTARVKCDRPGRYARQLASHFAQTQRASWDPEAGRGELTFTDPEGTVDMIEGDGVLLIHLQCPPDSLDRLEELVGAQLARSGCDDALEIVWKRPGGVEGSRWVATPDA